MSFLTILAGSILAFTFSGKIPLIRNLGSSVLSFILGLILGLLLPQYSVEAKAYSMPFVLGAIIFYICSSNIKEWFLVSKDAFSAFFIMSLAIILVALGLGIFLGPFIGENATVSIPIISAILIGGMLNMASLSEAFGVSNWLTVNIHAANIIVNGPLFVFTLTTCMSAMYSRFPMKNISHLKSGHEKMDNNFFIGCFSFFVISLVFISENYLNLSPIQSITVISVVSIFITMGARTYRYQRVESLGEFFLTCYFTILGMSILGGKGSGSPDFMVLLVSFLMAVIPVTIYYFICRKLKIDRDTFFVVAVACIFGPAYILPIAARLDNKDIIKTGIILSVLGIIIANFVGLFIYKVIV